MRLSRETLLAAGLCALPWSARAWNTPVRLSPVDPMRDHLSVDVAVAPGGPTFVAWQQLDAGELFDSDVMLSCSDDGGAPSRRRFGPSRRGWTRALRGSPRAWIR